MREVGGSQVSHWQVAKWSEGQADESVAVEVGVEVEAMGAAGAGPASTLSVLSSEMVRRLGAVDTLGLGGASDESRCSALRARNETACRRCPDAAGEVEAVGDAGEGTGQTNGPSSRVGEGEITLMEGTGLGWECTKPCPSLGLVRAETWRERAAAKATVVFIIGGEEALAGGGAVHELVAKEGGVKRSGQGRMGIVGRKRSL